MKPLIHLAAAALRLLLAVLFLLTAAFSQDDVILRAMKDELERSRQLRIVSLDAPYFFEYRVEDASLYTVAATMGALVGSNQSALRIPFVKVRVGDYAFDNSNHIYSDFYAGTRYDPPQLPLENDYLAMRQVLWLATDRSYKTAADAIARKRATMKNLNLPEQLPDFSKAPAVQTLLPIHRVPFNETQLKDRIVKLSGVFNGYPKVISSGVDVQITQSTDYLVNSEGASLRYPEDLAFIRMRAYGLATDGASVRDAEVVQAFEVTGIPADVELRRQAAEMASNVTALTQAPTGEAYTGPVMFESRAAAQLFGQLLGDNLKITRKPLAEPGRPAPYLPSELENRIGARVLPEWMDVVDDPTQTEFHGHMLFGHYLFDMEGVAPKPLTLIEKGVLKTFALTRSPVVKGFDSSNGRGRMPGAFGHNGPGFGNLFIRASQTTPAAGLKTKLIEMCKQRNKPFGILIRKMDFPSSASIDELRRLSASNAQSGGGSRPVSLPLLVYRVYPDGREELVRGLRFRGLSTRSLKDISAASDENYVLDFMDSPVPFALMGAGNFVTNASVIAPAVLFEELELEPIQEDLPKLPIVPPPPLDKVSAGGADHRFSWSACADRRRQETIVRATGQRNRELVAQACVGLITTWV
jgi:TldD protein